MSYIDILGQKAKACKKDIAFASTTQKNDALLEIAHILRVCKDGPVFLSTEVEL